MGIERDNLLDAKLTEQKSNNQFMLFIAIIVFVLTVLIFINNFVLITVRVSGSSMSPTLYGGGRTASSNDGDILLVNKMATPTYGDIVVIEGVESYWLIKRVIAMEGDTIKIEDGKVYLQKSGETTPSILQEDYTSGHATEHINDKWKEGYTLKENEVFYLGDNRSPNGSSDSRIKGVCKESNIVGVVTDWSLDNKEGLKGIHNFFAPLNQIVSKITGFFSK